MLFCERNRFTQSELPRKLQNKLFIGVIWEVKKLSFYCYSCYARISKAPGEMGREQERITLFRHNDHIYYSECSHIINFKLKQVANFIFLFIPARINNKNIRTCTNEREVFIYRFNVAL